MRLRQGAVLAAAMLTLAALTGSAVGAAHPSSPPVRVTVTEVTHDGVPLSRARLAATGTRSLQASGCRQVDVAKTGKSFLFRTTVYKWHQVKRWCWSNGRITSVIVSAYVTNMDPNWYYRGLAAQSSYFTGSQTGHYSFRQAKLENCVFKFGCVGSEYPWVAITVRGDGSYSAQTGS